MDLYSFHSATVRYVMNANANDQSSWIEIFKFIPSLRQMLSCCVCGNIALRPHSSDHNVCLHLVCEGCVGGKMRLKPACGWCKDVYCFVENKRAQVLIHCFKRLCLYISSSELGQEIHRTADNGLRNEVEKMWKIVEEGGHLEDDYKAIPAPQKIPKISKLVNLKLVQHVAVTEPSTSDSLNAVNEIRGTKSGQQKYKLPISMTRITASQARSRSNVAQHVKRLKKKARHTQVVKSKQSSLMSSGLAGTRSLHKPHKSISIPKSNRPHRVGGGRFSVGQLWRETFLEDELVKLKADNVDSSIVNSVNDSSNVSKSSPVSDVSNSKYHAVDTVGLAPIKETRSNHGHLSVDLDVTVENKFSSQAQLSRRGIRSFHSASVSFRASPLSQNKHINNTNLKRGFTLRSGHIGLKQKSKLKSQSVGNVCKCARFKHPSQMTCSGQKCPCYSDKRACVDCMCNGCKNPVTPDSAPPLMRCLRDGVDISGHNRSMPRLSPIPN